MKLHYSFGSASKQVDCENPQLMLTDNGSYIYIGAEYGVSAYNGIAFLNSENFDLVKFVHDIRPDGQRNYSIVRGGNYIERLSDGLEERFFFNDKLACYNVIGSAKINIMLDIRSVDNYDTEGRNHVISTEGNVVKANIGDKKFIMLCNKPVEILNDWAEVGTSFDQRRGGAGSWWVHKGVVVSASDDTKIIFAPEERLEEAKIFLAASHAWNKDDQESDNLVLSLAKNSLSGLICNTPAKNYGIIAGLPWFYQVYTRDEAISVGALLIEGKFELAGSILLREISELLPDGRIPNRFPSSEIGSADGVGWSFFRLSQLFDKKRETLTGEQWGFVRDRLKESLKRLAKQLDNNLVENGWKETWMDTTGKFLDGRPGARVEIQALTLAMLKFCHVLCDYLGDQEASYFASREQLVKTTSRELLFDERENMIYDGYVEHHRDGTIRPNVFLAYYVYPELLSQEEWKNVAIHYLDHLLTDWGGITSIDKEHLMFHEYHSGMNDDSYHRGDVWYFLNNLTAICLLRIHPDFRDVAIKIRDASVREMLEMGAPGNCSEISSACCEEAFGCFCQAWSAATLIELDKELE